MARSLGDSEASLIGVIHDPTVEHFSYNSYEDEVLILASDGLWDVVTPDEAVNFVQKYRRKCAKQISRPPPKGKYIRKKDTNIAHFLGEWARDKWITYINEEDVLIDDIGIVVVEFICEGSMLERNRSF